MDADAGTVYGQVVAKIGDSVFVLPMKTLIDEIKQQRESSGRQVTVSLPSPSILLTDLANYHRHILADTEKADRYEQAAVCATPLDKSEGSSSCVRPRPASAGPLGSSDSVGSKHLWPDPARSLLPGMQGLDTAKQHSSPTYTGPIQGIAKVSKPLTDYTGDVVVQYTHMEFSKRTEFYHSLHGNDQRRIDAYLRRVTQIRGAMASGKHPSLLNNILSSVKNWRDTMEDKNVPGRQRKHRAMSLGPEISEGPTHRGSTSQTLFEYDALMDIKATKTMYPHNNFFSEPDVDVEEEVIPLKHLLQNPARWFQRRMPSDRVTCVTHIHIPATNMEVRTVNMRDLMIPSSEEVWLVKP